MNFLIDTHCHLDFPAFRDNALASKESIPLSQVLTNMGDNRVHYAVAISVNWEDWPNVHALAMAHDNIYCTVGVHPDYEGGYEPSEDELVARSAEKKVMAIGECGLDYFHCPDKPAWQEERFRRHIRASTRTQKPLVIHSRDSGVRLIEILREEGASPLQGGAGGVLHCFTDTWDIAKAALDMGFYISFSGIVTFKNAQALKEVAKKVPADQFVIETDSPYLAPHPHRGVLNQPSYVTHVAQSLSELRQVSMEMIAEQSTRNAIKLFRLPI